MPWLSDDPSMLIGTCIAAALVCLIVTKVTGRGKFLIFAAVAAALAGVFWLVDLLWVTDVERIESVVTAVAAAAERSDAEAVLAHLTDDVEISIGVDPSSLARGELARALIRSRLAATRFEFIRVTGIHANAAPISRRGRAEFDALIQLSRDTPEGSKPLPTEWSFGLTETQPGTWRVNRVTAVRIGVNANLNQP